MAQRKVYYIPDNFVDDEKIFGGKFRKRNFIEAVIFTLPVLGLFWLINWATGIGWGTLFYPTFLFGIATFFLFIIGYNGDSWGETLLLAQKFRSNKFNISTYNPRVKTELTADYLANPNANSKDEKPVVAHCDVFSLTYINTFKQDGLYLRDGELWVNPSAEPFFSIQDALDFIPLENICGVLLPSGEVYL